MLIGLDARVLETGHRFRGIGFYALNLIKAIIKFDKKNSYLFLTQSEQNDIQKLLTNNDRTECFVVRKAKNPEQYNWFLDQYFLPKAIKYAKIDIVHFLEQLSCPLIKTTKELVTIHDLVQFDNRDYVNWKIKIKFLGIKHANKIIAISHSTKNEIIEKLKIPEEKISVIYNGYNDKVFNNKELIQAKEIQRKLTNGRENFLFYLGTYTEYEPRKNIDFLIRVFAQYLKKYNSDIYLVLGGKTGQESERIKTLAKKLGVEDKLIFTGFISEREVSAFYKTAQLFLFPSLHEGFGLPPLEAMASGCPVISSNKSSLPEVVGEGGILLEPDDQFLWVKEIGQILSNKNYSRKLIDKGLKQAKKFSWEKCAKETINIYQEIYDTKN